MFTYHMVTGLVISYSLSCHNIYWILFRVKTVIFFLAINDKMVAINLLKTMQSSSMNIAVLQQRVCLGPMLLTTKKSSVDHSWILIQQGNRTVQVSSLLVFNNLWNPCCILPPFYCMIWYVPVFHTFENQW